MLSQAQRDYVRTVTRTVQIIVGAMAASVLVFLGIVVVLVSQNAQAAAAAAEPIVTYTAIGMTIAVGIAWLIVPGVVVGRMRQSLIDGRSSQWVLVKSMSDVAELGDVVPLAAIYQTRAIIGVALLEGAAFLSNIAYLLEHQPIALYIAGVLLLTIVSQIPTVSRLESWLESELASIEQMRQMR